MIELDINNYIDFNNLFIDLFRLHETELMQYRAVNEVYQNILNFYNDEKKNFEIMSDECFYHDNHIVFVYGRDFNDCNESCTQSTTADYTIIFDKEENEFSACDYEQG